MKRFLPLAAILAMLAAGSVVQAQDRNLTVDSDSTFRAMQADSNGTVAQKLMHAPAGDVLALYIGRLPKQVYTKQDDLLYIISGYGHASVGYPSFDVKPGSIISIPRNSAFEIQSTGAGPIKAILIATPQDNPDNKKVL